MYRYSRKKTGGDIYKFAIGDKVMWRVNRVYRNFPDEVQILTGEIISLVGTSKGTRAKLSNIERAAGRVKSKSPRNKGKGKKN